MSVPKLQMGLTTEPFEDLLEKRETIDIRLDEPLWAELEVGDVIEFLEDPGEQRSLRVEILELLHYPTFRALFEAFPLEQFGVSSVEAGVNAMYRWWSRDDEQQWGVLGLRIRLLDDTDSA